MKIHDGTTWQEAKSLRINNGSSWVSAAKGWVYDNGWKLSYPNYPVLSSGFLSISGTPVATVGTTYTANIVWLVDPAYLASSYSYKWYRSGTLISGATSQTYLTVVADVDKIISCRVEATNARGTTSVLLETGATILPRIATMEAAFDTTLTPTATVSLSVNGLSYSGSWSSSNATTVSISSTNGQAYPDSSGASGTYSGIGSAGPIRVDASLTNTRKRVYLQWSAAPGAASYDVIKYGNNVETKVNIPSNQTSYIWDNIADGNETNYFSVYPKSAVAGTGYGVVQTVTASNKYGSASASSSLYEPYPTAPTNVIGSDDSSADSGSFSWSASTSPIGRTILYHSYTINRDGSYYTSGTTTGTSVAVASTGSFTISVTGFDGIWTSNAGTGSGTFTVKSPGTPSPSTSGAAYNQFNVSWTAITGASSYSVKVGTSAWGSNILDTTTTNTSATISGLSASTTYYVTIAAYKNGYGYGSNGYTTGTTTVDPTVNISAPNVQFERTATQIKWGIDNGYWTGPFDAYGIEWEVRTGAGSGTVITSGNTINYTTTMTKGPVNGYSWNYWVRSTTDLPYSSSPRYLRARMYGYNSATNTFVDGTWSGWS